VPRNKYPEETVQKILDVSLKLFLEKGYEQTTILEIVDHLGGLTRGAFYHHFKSKEEVLAALSDKLFFDNNPFEKVKNETELNGLQKIKRVIILSYESPENETINIVSVTSLKNPRFLAELVESNQELLAPLWKELIEEGIKDGSIKTPYAKPLSELFTLITNFWYIPSIFPCTKQEFLDKVVFSKDVLDNIGMPVFDDEIMKYIEDMAGKLELK